MSTFSSLPIAYSDATRVYFGRRAQEEEQLAIKALTEGCYYLVAGPPANPNIRYRIGILLGINWYGYVIIDELCSDNRLLVIALLL